MAKAATKKETVVNSKGQVTLFIIIGVLLLLAVILFVVLNEETTLAKILPERLFPSKTNAIERYIDGCIEMTGREGLTLAGAQGGYIWLPSYIENNPLAHIDTGIKVPLWQYYTENRIPSLELIEAQLSRYITNNLKSCVANLDVFKETYTITEKGDISTEVETTDELVRFKVMYPIDVMSKDGTKIVELLRFEIEVPVKLKQMHEVAKSIMEKEAKDMKFERIAIDLISMDPDIPLSDFELSCTRKLWKKSDVNKKIKTLLTTNIPSIRVDSTNYLPVPEDQPYILNHYVWPVTEQQYNDISASFTFVGNKLYRMDARPNSGELLKSGEIKGSKMASFLCIQQWKFVYDIDVPIQVTVEDMESNYNINFGFIARVRNNYPNHEPMANAAQLDFTGSTDEVYCNNLYGDYSTKIFTFDNVSDPQVYVTNEPINNVNITFTCLKYTCNIGKTKYIDGGASSILEIQLPYCVNGILRGNKPGYKPAQQFYTTTPGGTVNLYLTPIMYFNYTLVKHMVTPEGVLGPASGLDTDEKAFITITYSQNNTKLHETWGGYPAEKNAPVQPIELLSDGNFPYNIDIYIMDDEDLVGGYQTKWNPSWLEIKNGKHITFHTIVKGKLNDIEMLAFLADLSKMSKDETLAPVIR